jgi:glycine cleavage system H protein
MVAILVALMFITFVLIDLIVQKLEARPERVPSRNESHPLPVHSEVRPLVTGVPLGIPQGVYLSEDHTWFMRGLTGEVRVGADTLVAHAVGKPERVFLPKVGEFVKKDQPLFRLLQGTRILTISSSVSGKVVAANDRLQEHPELVASEPYGAGWVCAVVPTVLDEMAESIRFGAKAAAWLEGEFERFHEFVKARVSPDLALGVTSFDGGLAVPGCLAERDEEVWSAFEAEFLRPR